MYCPVVDEASCENVRLTVKHTFIEYQCLHEHSPKFRRRNSDPVLPSLALARSIAVALKCPEASTPTTCASVNGDSESEDASPSSPFSDDCDDSGFGRKESIGWPITAAFGGGNNGLGNVPSWSQDQAAIPHSAFASGLVTRQQVSLPAPTTVLSTCPTVAPASTLAYSNDARVGLQDYFGGSEMDTRTTVMVRNLPQDLTQPELMQHLISGGYRGLFDFIYMPMNFRAQGNFGYAFVNFKSNTIASQVMTRLQSHEEDDILSSLRWNAMWSTCQGFSANVERYRNSPLMHESVPQDCKPSLYDDYGDLAAFPAPTKSIPKPRIHRPRDAEAVSF